VKEICASLSERGTMDCCRARTYKIEQQRDKDNPQYPLAGAGVDWGRHVEAFCGGPGVADAGSQLDLGTLQWLHNSRIRA
jgi:hypothetical protein